MIKLIISDIDGTLLNSQGQLPTRFHDVFTELKAQNILFGVASGRQYYSLLTILKKYQQDIFFISNNGSMITYKNEILYEKSIDRDILIDIISYLKTIPEIYIFLYGKEYSYLEESDLNINDHFNDKAYYHIVPNILHMLDKTILKIALYIPMGNAVNESLRIKDALPYDIHIAASTPYWIDITAKNANKGSAVQFLKTEFNFKSQNMMAFGDYLNDIEMLKSVKYSYAMDNAHDYVKKNSRFQTTSNNENGVLLGIKEHISLKIAI